MDRRALQWPGRLGAAAAAAAALLVLLGTATAAPASAAPALGAMAQAVTAPAEASSTGAATAAPAPAATAQANAAPPKAADAGPLAVSERAPGVWVHVARVEEWEPANQGDVGNLGFVVGSRCVAVIDTGGSPAVGERLRQAIERVTDRPICWVINTHAHPDHLLGNAAFATLVPRPEFIAHARLPAALAAREPYVRNAVQRDFGQPLAPDAIVYPNRTVAGRETLDLGGRELELEAWPTAHTDHDLTVLDRRTQSIFLGDLVFAEHMPALDGKLRGWLAVMDGLQQRSYALAIPGHGEPGAWPALVSAQRRYLEGLLQDVSAAIKAGRTLPQAVESVAPKGRWALSGLFHRRNVTAAYAELEWD